jgi:hypothetical protein
MVPGEEAGSVVSAIIQSEPDVDVAEDDSWTSSAREVFDFAGVSVVDSASSGYPYGGWLDRNGGWFVLPASQGRLAGEPVQRFSRVFPDLRRLDRLSWRLGAHRTLYLDAAAVDDLSSAMGVAADGTLPGFHVAVPGAYRKITVASLLPCGSARVYGKLAAHSGAEARILREHENLGRLATIGSLEGRVPRSEGLASFRGRSLLLLSAGPERAGERRFGRAVSEFLSLLHSGSRSESTIRDSGSVRRWRESVEGLTGRNGGGYPELLGAASDRLIDRLEGSVLPVSLAHGDFTAANTRAGDAGLFVFDWEAGFQAALPGHDAFHFVALPRALRGRALTRPSSVSRWIQQWCPNAARHVDELWLSYLLETGLHYASARESFPEEGDDRVFLAIVTAIARELGESR